jgi:hypothetical protein
LYRIIKSKLIEFELLKSTFLSPLNKNALKQKKTAQVKNLGGWSYKKHHLKHDQVNHIF